MCVCGSLLVQTDARDENAVLQAERESKCCCTRRKDSVQSGESLVCSVLNTKELKQGNS